MSDFEWKVDQFADLRVLRYQVPDFELLSLNQKKLIYNLSMAAAAGRDILFDQNYRHNLAIRFVLEAIYEGYSGDRTSEEFKQFETYLKRVWFSNGIHHHYGNEKFVPEISRSYFIYLLENTPLACFKPHFTSVEEIRSRVEEPIFNSDVDKHRVCSNPEVDMVACSSSTFYQGVTQKEAEEFYGQLLDPENQTPLSYGLNTNLVKVGDTLREVVWKQDGKYGKAITQIVHWLRKAMDVAENDEQRKAIEFLISFYNTGKLEYFDEYSITWVKDLASQVDFINGFIETYNDPLGYKATWESHVNFRNDAATQRTVVISDNAQWFEDHSPVDSKFKKKVVKGVSAKVINAAFLAGDCYPATPIGINLPNADWIRKVHGSKSVTIDNIAYAYDQASHGTGFIEEFAYSKEEVNLEYLHGFLADSLHTDMHECLGHGSGQLAEGVMGDELKSYGSTIEEARADLFALYYMMDPKMVELGLIPSLDVAKALYNDYIRNGLLTQMVRIELGKNVEEAHMRNRKLIAEWCFEKGSSEKVIAYVVRDGKTYVVVNSYESLRRLFGELLREIQRIKSTGDYQAAKLLVESYGVKLDQNLHKEILERYKKLGLAPYSGFINPVYKPVCENGEIVDVAIGYSEGYVEQMLRYSKEHSFLGIDG